MTDDANPMAPTDAERLELLDRIEKRIPELDLDQHDVEWIEMPDGAQGLAVNGGGFAGDGTGFTFANGPDDNVTAIGLLIPGAFGCVVIQPDGSRYIARVEAGPLRPN